MSVQDVRRYFATWKMEDRVQEFPVSSATVGEAALALQCNEERIAKTLAFLVDEKPVLVVMAGDRKIDNAKFKAFFHTKAKMLKGDDLPALVGHPAGGVCPFAVKDGVCVYLDSSLKRFETVFPACGSANSAIELTIPELVRYADVTDWVDVGKPV